MCTRVLYRGDDDLVITGRSMDWMVPTGSNLWALPVGLEHDGATAEHPLRWTSRRGSVISTMYDRATVEGVNDHGLAAHALYLAACRYPERDPALPGMSVAAWTQYALDLFSSVAAAVDGLSDGSFQVANATPPATRRPPATSPWRTPRVTRPSSSTSTVDWSSTTAPSSRS
jgi:choloylglycine hydrolase